MNLHMMIYIMRKTRGRRISQGENHYFSFFLLLAEHSQSLHRIYQSHDDYARAEL